MNLGFSSDFIAVIPEGLTVTADAQGKVTISGNTNLKVGINKVLITVTSESGLIRNYRIYVTRKDEVVNNE